MRSRSRGRRRSVGRGTYRSGIEPRNVCPVARAAGTPGCRRGGERRKAIPGAPPSRGVPGSRAVKDPVHVRKHLVRGPGDPTSVCRGENCRPCREVQGRTPMTNGCGKSDRSIEPAKSPNNAEGPAAEAMEGREQAKGNSPERNALRTQGRESTLSALERVRQAARKDKKQQFTALLHHIYCVVSISTSDAAPVRLRTGYCSKTCSYHPHTLDQGWLVKFIEHRIADRRVVRLIQKWLKAGVLEEGKRVQSEVGTVEGGSISPLLSNIYLHYGAPG